MKSSSVISYSQIASATTKKLPSKKEKFKSKYDSLIESPAEEAFYLAAKKLNFSVTLQKEENFGAFRIDFTHHGKNRMFAIEIDGQNFHTKIEDRERDYEKERYLTLKGYVVIRFTARETFRDPGLCVVKAKEIVEKWDFFNL